MLSGGQWATGIGQLRNWKWSFSDQKLGSANDWEWQ